MSIDMDHEGQDPPSKQDIRRAREFYRYLQPENIADPRMRRRGSTFDNDHEHVPSLTEVLTPFCQLAAVRCNARKALLNVMDRDVMYFLAEASRPDEILEEEDRFLFTEDPILVRCSAAPLKGRICELTLRLDNPDPASPAMFTIPDLTQSSFADMSIVAGEPHYRFYAGTPITTRSGVNIGSLAIMDTKIRPEGLSRAEEDFLGRLATQIMTYLETNRQAIDGRRSQRMAEGLEDFLAGMSSIKEEGPGSLSAATLKRRSKTMYGMHTRSEVDTGAQGPLSPASKPFRQRRRPTNSAESFHSSDLDDSDGSTASDSKDNERTDLESKTPQRTFSRAANILRECLSTGNPGGVVFMTLSSRFTKRSKRAREDEQQATTAAATSPMNDADSDAIPAAPVLASSSASRQFIVQGGTSDITTGMDESMLRQMIRRYPGGRLWSLDDTNQSSSDETNETATDSSLKPPLRRAGRSSMRKRNEINVLRRAFPHAKQLLFAPLWDSGKGSFAHAVFVSTAIETRSLSSSSELSFVNSFCSTVMSELSRLEVERADKQKSDFVGTVSHEMRSPLHGILASTEFLADTELDGFQRSLIDTIEACGRTLLDTINHVLDFSKVNSFQKNWEAANRKASQHKRHHNFLANGAPKAFSHGAPPLLQLMGVTDISAVLEEVVDGLVLGQAYTSSSAIDITDTSREARGRGRGKVHGQGDDVSTDRVEVIIDVEPRDWLFVTQPGAVRRIIMNITGNALKYTSEGRVTVALNLQSPVAGKEGTETMVLTVTDTGRGIGQQFLNSKLFVPFAQENALAPGTGLGLSIVHSIITMLGGTIDVESKVGKGTTIRVALPLQRPLSGTRSTVTTPHSGGTAGSGSSQADGSITLLQNQAGEYSFAIYRPNRSSMDDELGSVLSRYLKEWYQLQLLDTQAVGAASVVIVEEQDLESLMDKIHGSPGSRPAIVILCSVSSRHSSSYISSLEGRLKSTTEFVAKPAGPYKLAKTIRAALQKLRAVKPRFRTVAAMGVIPEQPTPSSLPAHHESMSEQMQDMDLNAPGDVDSSRLVVQATETFAASQASQNAQMALHDPSEVTDSPIGMDEGNAFPFPEQVCEIQTVEAPSPLSTLTQRRRTGSAARRSSANLPAAAVASNINPRILVVDDNAINRRLLETFLKSKRKCTRLEMAEDGKQAVDAFAAATDEPFEIIFMDISMPVMNGFEATRAIRELENGRVGGRGAMVIALTGLASGRDQSEGFDSGCDIYMTKPVSFKEVGKLLDNWEKHQLLRKNENGVDATDFGGAVTGALP